MTNRREYIYEREALLRLKREKRALALQNKALALLSLVLATVLGLILISL